MILVRQSVSNSITWRLKVLMTIIFEIYRKTSSIILYPSIHQTENLYLPSSILQSFKPKNKGLYRIALKTLRWHWLVAHGWTLESIDTLSKVPNIPIAKLAKPQIRSAVAYASYPLLGPRFPGGRVNSHFGPCGLQASYFSISSCLLISSVLRRLWSRARLGSRRWTALVLPAYELNIG